MHILFIFVVLVFSGFGYTMFRNAEQAQEWAGDLIKENYDLERKNMVLEDSVASMRHRLSNVEYDNKYLSNYIRYNQVKN